MSLGAYVLILMETDPATPTGPAPLWAGVSPSDDPVFGLIRGTTIPLQPVKWTNIVIHDSMCRRGATVRQCHFVIGAGGRYPDGKVMATGLWDRQAEGNHVHVPGFDFNANSIGICLLVAPGESFPTPRQERMLVRLVRALQVTLEIPRDHVYLHRELGDSDCPGAQLEAGAFRGKLVPPQ